MVKCRRTSFVWPCLPFQNYFAPENPYLALVTPGSNRDASTIMMSWYSSLKCSPRRLLGCVNVLSWFAAQLEVVDTALAQDREDERGSSVPGDSQY